MAAKKKAKTKKKAPAKKTKKKTKKAVKKTKTVAKKAKKAAKKSKKKVVKAAARKAPAKKAKTTAKKKKQIVGEGNYAASAKFDADQAGFVKRNKARIADLGKAAEKALEGPEGAALRDAEAAAAGRSRDTFDS